jgi:uncharacterized Zn finger protein (UPF0148 family)
MAVENVTCNACGAPAPQETGICPYCGCLNKPVDDGAVLTGQDIKRDLSRAYNAVKTGILNVVNKKNHGD